MGSNWNSVTGSSPNNPDSGFEHPVLYRAILSHEFVDERPWDTFIFLSLEKGAIMAPKAWSSLTLQHLPG